MESKKKNQKEQKLTIRKFGENRYPYILVPSFEALHSKEAKGVSRIHDLRYLPNVPLIYMNMYHSTSVPSGMENSLRSTVGGRRPDVVYTEVWRPE